MYTRWGSFFTTVNDCKLCAGATDVLLGEGDLAQSLATSIDVAQGAREVTDRAAPPGNGG